MTQLAPFAVFAVLILVVTAGVVVGVDVETTFLATELVAGHLTPANVQSIGDGLVLVWLASLAGFFLFSGLAVFLSLRVHRQVTNRVEQLVELSLDATEGRSDPPSPTLPEEGPLGRLEGAIRSLGAAVRERSHRLERDHARAALEAQLQRALEQCDTEEESLDVVSRALDALVPNAPAELLLADSSQAHLRRVAKSPAGGANCPVQAPSKCAAVRKGHTVTFRSSEDLDACPKLRGREQGPCSAVCAPLTVMGQTIGVLHVTGEAGSPPTSQHSHFVASIANLTGSRLGVLRTLATSQLQAATDSLTGLLNRRSFESNASALLRGASGASAVLMCDLDHFKQLNDKHGHDAGDRALRLFAETAKGALRQGDLIGRHGGEEFVFLLANAGAEGARKLADRVRARLKSACERYRGPTFTASFGAAIVGVDGRELPDLLERADAALYKAKRAGRNRLALASDEEQPHEAANGSSDAQSAA